MMGNLVDHYMRGLPTIIPQKCQLAVHTERLLDRYVFISTPKTKRSPIKTAYVAASPLRSKFDHDVNKVAFNNDRGMND